MNSTVSHHIPLLDLSFSSGDLLFRSPCTEINSISITFGCRPSSPNFSASGEQPPPSSRPSPSMRFPFLHWSLAVAPRRCVSRRYRCSPKVAAGDVDHVIVFTLSLSYEHAPPSPSSWPLPPASHWAQSAAASLMPRLHPVSILYHLVATS